MRVPSVATTPRPVVIDSAKLQERLQSLRRLDAQEHDNGQVLDRYLAQALHCAVTLVEFDPHALLAALDLTTKPEILERLFKLTESAHRDGDGDGVGVNVSVQQYGLWRLARTERQRIAREAGIEKLRVGRGQMTGSESAAQRMADALLFGTLTELSALSITELSALIEVRAWYDGAVEPLPSDTDLRARLALAQLFEPMRRLVGSHFVGRTHELDRLTDYVDLLGPRKVAGLEVFGQAVRYLRHARRSLIDNPPLYVSGPGGVGKSSLMARFILNHVDAPQGAGLPFVMLDFDRAQVESRMPLSLLVAALHQLRVQFPQHSDAMLRMAEHLVQVMRDSDVESLEKNDSFQFTIVSDFAAQIDSMFGGEEDQRRLLWVLDTFEEPQRLGESTVGALWELMNTLQQHLPRLRLVVCGRVVPRGFKWDSVPLDEFDDASAKSYLHQRLLAIVGTVYVDDKTLVQTIRVVGRTPLALRLAARLLAVEDHELLTLKLKRARVQGILFHRVIEHIRVDARLECQLIHVRVDDVERRLLEQELSKLVYPGLAVRHITLGVIEHVLAEPCGVKLRDTGHVARLFAALAQQVDIVEPGMSAGAEPSLLHRTDVRRMVLRDLEHQAGEKLIRHIDRRAVIYHARLDTLTNRAEEIYHRLRRQQSERTIRARWKKGIETYLTSALDEIASPNTRVMLAELLGVTLDREELASAEYSSWERQAIWRAADYLRAGSPERARRVLAERDRPGASSALLRLEAQVQQQLGNFLAASAAAERALAAAEEVSDFAAAAEAVLLLALTHEASGDLEAANRRLAQAREWAADLKDERLLLRVIASDMRIERKRGAPMHTIEQHIQDITALLNRDTRRALRSRPAVLRELLAEMGARDRRLLRLGLETLGVDLPSEQAAEGLARALAYWTADARLADVVQNIALAHGVLKETNRREVPAEEEWIGWLWSSSPQEIGSLLSDVIAQEPLHEELILQLSTLFRRDVDRRIFRGGRQRAV